VAPAALSPCNNRYQNFVMSTLLDPALFLPLLFISLVAICGAIVVIDIRSRIIPDGLTLAVGALGLAYVLLRNENEVIPALIGGLVAATVVWLVRYGYRRWRGIEGLGLGDVKLFGAAGIWTGLSNLPFMILVATGGALAVIAAQRLMGYEITSKTSLPFGPFIVFGLLVTIGMTTTG
jgi:prepilin signal peptidase PulO-like enzyme (type II secretory pathway)